MSLQTLKAKDSLQKRQIAEMKEKQQILQRKMKTLRWGEFEGNEHLLEWCITYGTVQDMPDVMLMVVPPPAIHRADVTGANADTSSLSSNFKELEQIEEPTSVILSPAPSEPASHSWAERTVFNSSPLSMMSTSSHSSFPSSPISATSLPSTSSLSPLPPAATFCESYISSMCYMM